MKNLENKKLHNQLKGERFKSITAKGLSNVVYKVTGMVEKKDYFDCYIVFKLSCFHYFDETFNTPMNMVTYSTVRVEDFNQEFKIIDN